MGKGVGGGGRVNNYRDNKNCTWFAIIISRALESNKTCSLRVVPCGREGRGEGEGKEGREGADSERGLGNTVGHARLICLTF